MSEQTEPALEDIIDRVRELRAIGLTWNEVWGAIRDRYRVFAAGCESEERARSYERLLSTFASDGEPVRPISIAGTPEEVGQ